MPVRRVRLTRRAAGLPLGALALFAVGTNVQAGWVLVVAALLGGIWITGLLLPVYALRGVEVARVAPPRARAGDPVSVGISLHNRGRRLRGLLRVQDGFLGGGSAVVTLLPPAAERHLRSMRTGARRGVHTQGRCRIESGAPFGVLVARREVDVPTTTVVVPRIFAPPRGARHRSAAWPEPGVSGDVAHVREYRHGDPLRHIHWPSSARRGQLVVRAYEQEQDAGGLTVVADAPPDGDTADAVAAAACSYALDALGAGYRVRPPRPHGSGPSQHETTPDAVLDWGATLGPDTPPLAELLAHVPAADSILCVLEPGPRAEGAIAALAALARDGRGVRVVLVAREDAVGRAGGGPHAAPALRHAGADVVEHTVEEVEAWCASPDGP